MPLVRYQVQCEHSLANPELYRSAGQDDSEGLLEGVATAGLVGIVRQLGDLAEFAAEIFHDLHDGIMTIVSQQQNLKARVARLEVDLPAMEKTLLAKSTQLQFAYRKRFKWRAPLPMNQKVFVDEELPRFVQNLYDDCRGPPRLFLLDKFDEAGRGACMKRYSDLTFFRLSWAASLVSKAEQQQRARETELLEKSAAAANACGPKLHPRERLSSALFENLEGFTGDFIPELWSKRMDRVCKLPTDGMLTPEEPQSPPKVAEGPVLAPLKMRANNVDMANLGHRVDEFNDEVLSDDDVSSDAEVYVDALTTMGSDPDSEPGSRTGWEADSTQNWLALEFEPESPNHSVLKALVEAYRCNPSRKVDHVKHDEGFVQRLGFGEGFDAVREWEDQPGEASDSVEVITVEDAANVIEDSQNCLAIVAHNNVPQEETLPSIIPDEPPDHLSEIFPYTLSDSLPSTLLDEPPDKLPDIFSSKLPDERLDDKLSDHPAKLPDKGSDKSKGSDKRSDKMPKKALKGKLSSAPPTKPPVRRVGKFSDKRSEKLSPKKPTAAKRPEKPAYQSHESVALLDSFRPSIRVKSIVASLEARAAENNAKLPPSVEEDCLKNSSSPVTTPRSRRQWEKNNATQIHSSILQLADMDHREVINNSSSTLSNSSKHNYSSELNSSLKLNSSSELNESSELSNVRRACSLESDRASVVNMTSTALEERILGDYRLETTACSPSNVSSPNTTISSSVEDEEGYSSSSASSSSPKGLPKFCALLSPSSSPPRVVAGLMSSSPSSSSSFLTNSCFDRKAARLPPITPLLADSPSVSRSSSLHVKPYSAPGNFSLRSPLPPSLILGAVACDSDKLMNVSATSPARTANENGVSSLSNSAPRPRTWVNRSESNVAATLQAIRQAAAVASDNDTGSECRSNCD